MAVTMQTRLPRLNPGRRRALPILVGLWGLVMLAGGLHPADASAAGNGVGLTRLEVADPLTRAAMEAAVFYPSPAKTAVSEVGPYDIAATRDAPLAEGRYPVVLISHGAGGIEWGHHDLATALARAGILVVAVRHPGDNFKDSSRFGSDGAFFGRPLQISAALDALLADPKLGPHAEANQVGFLGFSTGGATGLILAGAVPDFSRFEGYCATRPIDDPGCVDKGVIRREWPDLTPHADPRIKAMVLMAPLSLIFPMESLAAVSVPVLLYGGLNDDVLAPETNAQALAAALLRITYRPVEDAGHYAFLAPCTDRLAGKIPALCLDPPGFDRTLFHGKLSEEVVTFFRKTPDATGG